jgi:hypothetical protein
VLTSQAAQPFRCARLATGADYVRSMLEKAWTMSRPRFDQIPFFVIPFPSSCYFEESISMALQLFFCVAHGNCPGSTYYHVPEAVDARARKKNKKKKYTEWIRRNLAGKIRDINSVSDSLHVQVSSRAWLHVSQLQPLTPTISKMSSTFHFISNEIYAIANSREARLSVTRPTVLASGVRSRLSLKFLSHSPAPYL